jgi:Big-like domain-containing protein/beta-propeller repeat-containing protein
MKRAYLICLFQGLATTFLLSQSNPVPRLNQSARVPPPVSTSQADPKAQARILGQYGKLPLSFEANHGQTDGRVKFLSRTRGYSVFLTVDEAVLAFRGIAAKRPAPKGASGFGGATVSLKRYPDTNPNPGTNPNPATPQSMTGGVLRMKLRHANAAANITGTDELAGASNYFIGNNPTKWRTNVPTYAKVKYEGIYSGIDLVYYGNQGQLEYDFIVAPGADPRRIAFDVSGAKRIRRDAHGNLVLKMGSDEIRWHKPVVYQEKDGVQQEIAAHYAITDKNCVGFELGEYDKTRPLYLDPLIYSTYLGGSNNDSSNAIAVDIAGNAYVAGSTFSSDFPVTPGAFQPACSYHCYYGDAFVAKINPEGSALVYSTFLGGSLSDYASAIAVDDAGNAYVTGGTESSDFPTKNPLQPLFGGGYWDGFVTEINSEGSGLVYSTFLGGGGDENHSPGTPAIAVDSTGNTYVTGWTNSIDFPVSPNAFQRKCNRGSNCYAYGDAFVAKISPAGSAFVYSTYLGGSKDDLTNGIAADNAGNAYVTGSTRSPNFPTTPGAFQTSCGDGQQCQYGDAFVTKLNPSGSALVYSTFMGGSGYDYGHDIAVDSTGSAYVTGWTSSTNFPTRNAMQPASGGGQYDAFVFKLNPAGSDLVYSTYLGGTSDDWGLGIALDSSEDVYVIGNTESLNFPTVSPFQKHHRGGNTTDVFVSKLNAAGSALLFSTYLGGSLTDNGFRIAVDSSGNAYVTGNTSSTDFPTMNPLQSHPNGLSDGFVAKISVATTTTTLTSSPNPSTKGQEVTFTAVVTASNGSPPDGETVTFENYGSVLGTGTLSGASAVLKTSALPVGVAKITAVYGGDKTLGGSTSNPVKQVVK